MKRFYLFLLVILMCSSSFLFAAESKLGLELSPQASINGFVYSTDTYNLGGNFDFYKWGMDNASPTAQYVELTLFGDIKNKIDQKSSWGYGLYLYTLIGKIEGKKVDYDYSFAPYLKYDYLFTPNFAFSTYIKLIQVQYIKFANEDAYKAVSALNSSWYLTVLF